MKIPRGYGGLGMPLVYYGRALMLIGSVHPSLGALLSAHQSIGVPEPVRMFGTDLGHPDNADIGVTVSIEVTRRVNLP